jgi:hypothetical protein
MAYSWFKIMHGPFLNDVVLPGDIAYNAIGVKERES